MAKYIDREAVLRDWPLCDEPADAYQYIRGFPAADVVEEENILKFYYVRSIDEYWIGRRIDNFYYAEYVSERRQWTWTHSRYLPWGEHIVSPTSLWKEYTYPSEPEEIPFDEWLQGFVKKHAADVLPVVKARWIGYPECLKYTNAYSDDHIVCSACEECFSILDNDCERFNFCPNCGADMMEESK